MATKPPFLDNTPSPVAERTAPQDAAARGDTGDDSAANDDSDYATNVNESAGDQAIDNGDPPEGDPLSQVVNPRDLPEQLITQDGPPPIDPDGGGLTTVTASGAGAKGSGAAAEAADPVVASNLAGLRVGSRDEPVEIVDDGDKPGEEGSAVEGARAGLADAVPDDFGSIGLDDVASGEEDAEDDSGSLDGLDPPVREAPAFSEKPDIVDLSGAGGDQGGDTSAKPPKEAGQLEEEFASRGDSAQDYAAGDFGADPDRPPSGGEPSVESGGNITTTVYTDPQSGWSDVVTLDWDNPEGLYPKQVAEVSPDGTYIETNYPGQDPVVMDEIGGQNAIIHPDGSMTIIDTKTGQQTTEPPPPKPDESASDAGTPPGDTEVVLTAEEQQELRDSIDALGQHRGDQGTDTQPVEGDDGGFGAGVPKSEIAITESSDRAIDMLGQPGSSDSDFGGGGAGGGNNSGDPNFGTIDPAQDADAARQTDGPQQDAFDRQRETLEQTDDSSDDDNSDDGGSDNASVLQPGDLRPAEETEHLREVTLDIG